MGIGAEIARARNAAGLSHAELAERTRIRAGIIQAIERDDFTKCGGDVFARGHVKALATALNLDPTPLLAELGAVQAPTTFAQEEPTRLDIWELRRRSREPSERRSWLAVTIVAVMTIGIFAYFVRSSTSAPELVPPKESVPTATTTPTPVQTIGPSTTNAPVDSTVDPLPPQETTATEIDGAIVIELACVSSSWVRITNDLGTLYEGTMQAGESKAIASDTAVRVRIGNAAGIRLTYNGTTYDNLGGPGEVYTNTFSVG